jgi:D-glycero-D-manno-heptose 1,7-bisphosphate phosphatase
MLQKAIFFDRDGVLTEEGAKPVREHELKIYREAFAALKLIPDNFKKIIFTNQAWVAKGLMTEEEVNKTHRKLQQEFKNQDIVIDGIYICPHMDAHNCSCRKPKPGMLLQAQKEHRINLEQSYVIGDMLRDLVAGKEVGCTTILVMTGHAGEDRQYNLQPDFIVKNVYEAVQLILQQEKKEKRNIYTGNEGGR